MPVLELSSAAARRLCRAAAGWLVLGVATPAAGAPACVAPGAPGEPAFWTNGNKQGVGTARGLASRVWFALGEGVLQEVYYPRIDRAQTRQVELLVGDEQGGFESETRDARHTAEVADPQALLFRQVNQARSGRWRVTKLTLADPQRDVVLQRVRFEALGPGTLRLFVHFDPALGNSALGDRASVPAAARGVALLATERGTTAALLASPALLRGQAGFAGRSEGLAELRAGRPLNGRSCAGPGNVALVGELGRLAPGETHEFTLALAFGDRPDAALAAAEASLAQPFESLQADYSTGWRAYVAGLAPVEPAYSRQYAMAAMLLAAHEDKTVRGAMIASLTKPWGHRAPAEHDRVGGYHLVWSRDLYHVATAFMAMGDRQAAERALDFLFRVQQRPDGSLPQNSWLDGRPYWPSLQLDEVAYPLVLAHELGRRDEVTYRRHVRPAAEFIARRGPATPQERWEEESGYSPATIAAEIAGLVAAAAIAAERGDLRAASRWRARAREWAANVEAWTVTRSGPHSAGPYYLRLAQRGRPDSGAALEINNGGGRVDERAVVDAGFLELVRFGIRPPDDALVVRSLQVVDRLLRVETPRGPGFYRYNHDGYGEHPDGSGYDGTGVGRLWPLLTGERGEYELAAGRDARPWLDALAGFAGETLMLPEQVWDRPAAPLPHLRFGQGTGSATPLAWSCAGFIRLALGVRARRPVSMPEVVQRFFDERHEERHTTR